MVGKSTLEFPDHPTPMAEAPSEFSRSKQPMLHPKERRLRAQDFEPFAAYSANSKLTDGEESVKDV